MNKPLPATTPASTSEAASSSPFTEDQPVITELEGFPDPVRDPQTGMIIPQSRKERKALEQAQEHARARLEQDQQEQDQLEQDQLEQLDNQADTEESPSEPFVHPLEDEQIIAQAVTEPPVKTSRAGRNLPAAIAVGLALLVPAIVGLIWLPWLVAILIVVLLLMGTWEVARALKPRGINVPLAPLWTGAILMPAAAYIGGIDTMVFALFGTMLLALFWCVIAQDTQPVVTVMATMFIIIWVPFFLSFGVVLLHEPQGNLMVASMLLIVVANDTFGYIAGVTLGKHPMAPKISPKKSWEGFAGSLIGAMAIGALCFHFLLSEPWPMGLVLGALLVVAGTAGDFSESMVKRELKIKDMGNTLPGHGGAMDRLDSLVFAAPVAFLVFVVIMS